MAQPRTDGSSEGHSDTLHEDTYLHSTEASATLDSSNSTKFRPYSQLLAALLFILLYVYITLIALMVTGYLDHRTFDIDNIGLVSTVSIALTLVDPGGLLVHISESPHTVHRRNISDICHFDHGRDGLSRAVSWLPVLDLP